MMFHEFPFCFSLLSASRRPIGALFQKSRRKGNALPSLEFGALGATAPSNGHRSAFLRALEYFLMPIRNFSFGHWKFVRRASDFRREAV